MAHITEYFIFTFLLYNAFRNTFDLTALFLFIYPAGAAILYAISDEIHQLFVVGRSGSPKDVLIDSIGVFLFYAVRRVLRKRIKGAC